MSIKRAVAVTLALAACGGEQSPTNPVIAPDTAAVAPDTATVLPDPRAILADTLSVRAIYAIPTDREYRSTYERGIQNALIELQYWYREQMPDNSTFRLYSSLPTVCALPHPQAHYWLGAFDKILRDVQECESVGTGDFVWLVWSDVAQDCFGGTLERARYSIRLGMMSYDGLNGLVDPNHAKCGYPVYGPDRWIGLAGHELGHAFGLPHPPGCDAGDWDVCDADALMYTGSRAWPDTYLRSDEKSELSALPHFRR